MAASVYNHTDFELHLNYTTPHSVLLHWECMAKPERWMALRICTLNMCGFVSRKPNPRQKRRKRRRSKSSRTLFTSSFCISVTMLSQSAGKHTLYVAHTNTWTPGTLSAGSICAGWYFWPIPWLINCLIKTNHCHIFSHTRRGTQTVFCIIFSLSLAAQVDCYS